MQEIVLTIHGEVMDHTMQMQPMDGHECCIYQMS